MRLTNVIPFTKNTMLITITILFLLVVLVATEPDPRASGPPETDHSELPKASAAPQRAAIRWTRVRPSRATSQAPAGQVAEISQKS